MRYTIGSRGSRLALAQTESVRRRLQEAYPEHSFSVVVVKTEGDRVQDRPLYQMGQKGVFVKEIEENLLSGEIDLAVHSMKDMPTETAPGLTFAAAWTREDARDVLVLREAASFSALPAGAAIGTGSRRRAYQLKRLRPDLRIVGIRGNVETRLRKMEEQKLDGLVLAAAGLKRLGLAGRITEYLDFMVPAPAQGALAIEVREDRAELLSLLETLSDPAATLEVRAERAFLRRMGGGCHMPVGAKCTAKYTADGTRGVAAGAAVSVRQDRTGDGEAVSGRRDETGDGAGAVSAASPGEGQYLHMDVMYGSEDGSRLAYASVDGEDPEELAALAERRVRSQLSGRVALVGAGPGDPGLVTVRALAAVRDADCILYDRLVPPGLLREAKAGCERICVGKAEGRHMLPQEEICRLLADKALTYQSVVRLKGGDGFVFGRGGEEAAYLTARGIDVAIVPGVSSCIAGPAAAGIPVTSRGVSSGFHVVTAHSGKESFGAIDFEAMARSDDTCVFLMGLSRVEEVARGLLDAGLPGDTPAAVVSCATTPKQRTCVGTLVDIAKKVKCARLVSPAVIVVGRTVALRKMMGGWAQDPCGREILIPATVREGAHPLGTILRDLGAQAREIPVGRIELSPVRLARGDIRRAAWIAFTSGSGVDGFFESLFSSGLDARELFGVRIAAVGEKTAKRLEAFGLRPDLVPRRACGEALAAALLPQIAPTDTVLYPTGDTENGEFARAFSGDCRCRKLCVYRNVPTEPEHLEVAPDTVAAFTCASAAERFLTAMSPAQKEAWKEHGSACAIGPSTAGRLCELGVKTIWEAPEASYRALAYLAWSVSTRSFPAGDRS